LAIADAYVYFRYKKFMFRSHPANNTAMAMGFVPVVDGNPASVGQVMELLSSTFAEPSVTKPGEWVNVRKEELAGPFPWYKTVDGTPDVTEEYPGSVILRGTGADPFTIEFRCVVELKEGVATANTPQELELVRRRREMRVAAVVNTQRKGLIEALKPVPVPAVAMTPPSQALMCAVCGRTGAHDPQCCIRTTQP